MTMEQEDVFAEMMLTDEEREVDPQLGYPRGYAKLCASSCTSRAAAAAVELHGLVTPFRQGPPHRFLPYPPQSGDFATLKEWDGLFPTVAGVNRDPENAHQHAEELWQQLDHLGNAGFDPAKFRVDPYGNVVYWNADPSSPLAWEIDHWFPHSRGGKTVVTNLRVVQWQASQRKKNRLEFLVPWWDLQHGCSINQFLSAFASKNADFRKRSFALFFSGGEDASVAREHVGECRPWPQQFREKKAQCGLAAAAIVVVPKENDANASQYHPSTLPLKPLLVCDSGSGMKIARRRWSAEEEEALLRGVGRFSSSGSWKEIKETEPALANRSTLQLKEKFRTVRADWQNSGKENVGVNFCKSDVHPLDRHSAVTATNLQKELRVKSMREEEKRERESEIEQLEETVANLKQQNERERAHAVELEAVLSKHKRRVEKQRRWAETQSSYRLCLERMIRDTMHQSISYKEQARLNQAACNALKARLDCQKAACKVAEKDLLRNYSQRGSLEASVAGVDAIFGSKTSVKESAKGGNVRERSVDVQGRDIVDVSSCVSVLSSNGALDGTPSGDDQVHTKILLHDLSNLVDISDHSCDVDSEDDATADEVYTRRVAHRRTKDQILLHQNQQEECARKSRREDETLPPRFQVGAEAGVGFGAVEGDYPEVFGSEELQVASTRPGAGLIDDHLQCPGSAVSTLVSPKLTADERQQVQKSVVIVEQKSDGIETRDSNLAESYFVASDTVDEKGVVYKEDQYLDEIIRHVRFQLPAANSLDHDVTADNSPGRKSEEHLDELLHQVLATHLERIRKTEAARPQLEADASDVADDEKLRQIGKQNLDKWLQMLLFDVESAAAGSCPAAGDQLESPLHRAFSPAAFSQMSALAVMHARNLNLEAGNEAQDHQGVEKIKGGVSCSTVDRPKGLWGVLLRKLSAREQQSEQCLSNKLDAESDIDIERPAAAQLQITDAPRQRESSNIAARHHQAQLTNASPIVTCFGAHCDVDSYSTSSTDALSRRTVGASIDGDGHDGNPTCSFVDVLDNRLHSSNTMIRNSLLDITEADFAPAPQVITRITCTDHVPAASVMPSLSNTVEISENHFTAANVELRRAGVHFPAGRTLLSDVDEMSETDSVNSSSTCEVYLRQALENKDPNCNKTGLRASIKAAGLVWKKAVKKLETRLQDGPQEALE